MLNYIEEKIWLILWYVAFVLLGLVTMFLLDMDTTFLIFSFILYCILLIVYIIVSYHFSKKKNKEIKKIVDELEEKYLVSELLKKPKNLENEGYYYALKKATKAMNDKITELEHKYQEYEEYIESFVHEIKTPLAALSLYSDNKKDSELKEEIKKMDNLVEQVLYYARSENTEKDYFVKKIKLSEIIHQVLMQNKDYLLKNKIRVETKNLDLSVATDEKWVVFIINQIINNSCKYMNKEEKKIMINGKTEKNKIILEITDNGCGIKESDLPRVFEKGFTGNDRKKEHSTGMGLFLCKKLCNKLNLNITIESKVQEYTKVIIIFPKSSLHERKNV